MQPDAISQLGLLRRVSRGLWPRIIAGTLLTLLSSAFALPLAYIVKEAFDTWLPKKDTDSLLIGCLIILTLRLTTALLSVATRTLNVYSTESMVARLRGLLADRMYRLSQGEYDASRSGAIHDLVITESNRLRTMLSFTVSKILPATAQGLVLTFVLAYLSLPLLLTMLVVWPVLWVFNEFVRRYLVKKVHLHNSFYRDMSRKVFEDVRLLKLIKLTNQEKEHRAQLEGYIQKTSAAARPMSIMDTTYLETQGAVLATISVAVLLLGGHQVADRAMTVGDFISFYVVVNLLNGALREFAIGLYHVFVGRESLSHILDWLNNVDQDVYSGNSPLELRQSLELENVDFSYREGQPVLNQLNLKLERGITVVLEGPNGCGKSTVMWLLLGLYRPQSGHLTADNVDFEELDVGAMREQIGVVSQDAFLVNGSIGDNISFGCLDVTKSELQEVARLAGALEWIESLPEGFDTSVGREGTLLSGGQKQRISLARALLRKPKFLFFDEPTNHLDAKSVKNFLNTLQDLDSKPGILIITHDRALRVVSDRLYRFHQGTLMEETLTVDT